MMKNLPKQGIFTDSLHSPMGMAPVGSEIPFSDTIKDDWEKFELVPCKYLREGAPKPRNFQQYCVYQSLKQNNLCNGCGTGLGKTLMCYLTYFYYKMKYPNTKLIVITTASAVMQYAKEFYKFFEDSEFRPCVFHDGMHKGLKGCKSYAEARKLAVESFSDMTPGNLTSIYMNYSVLLREGKNLAEAVKSIRKQGGRVFLILDEASHFKNLKSQTFNTVYALSKLSDKVLAATATITNGRLEEIYAVLKGINITPFGNKADFLKRFCVTVSLPGQPFGFEIMGYKNVQEFVSLVKPYLVSLRRKDVLTQLPSVSRHICYVDHDDEQYDIISDLYNGVISFMPSEDSKRMYEGMDREVFELTVTNYIKMALQDPFILSPEHQRRPKGYKSPKTREIIRILEEEVVSESVIIYTPSKRYMYALRDVMKASTTLPKWYTDPLIINGDIPTAERERVKEVFTNDPSHKVIIINEAASEAINLQTAQAMIICSIPPTFGRLVQVVGRYNRIGSKHESLSLYYLLTKDSQDEDEYMISNQQGLMVSSVTKEDYEGVLDLDYINQRKKDTVEEITDEDLRNASIPTLVFKKRARRKQFYAKRKKKK